MDHHDTDHAKSFLDFVVADELFLLFFDRPVAASSEVVQNVLYLAPGGVVAVLQRLPVSQRLMSLLQLESVDGVLDSLAQHEIWKAKLLFEGFIAVILEHFSVSSTEIILKILPRFLIVVGEGLNVEISSGAHEWALVVQVSAVSSISLETVVLGLEAADEVT